MALVNLTEVVLTVITLQLLWIIYTVVYRLFLSPLAHIPGPKLAALTSWYEFYFDCVQPGKFTFKIKELHERYGPILRVTPREIHINDVGFLDTLYAGSLVRRDKDSHQTRTLPVPLSLGATNDHDTHRKRRAALIPFLNKKSVISLESMVNDKVERLCHLIQTHVDSQTPIDLTDAYYAFANDVVSNYSFGHDSNLLADETLASSIHRNGKELLLSIHVNGHFPWLVKFLQSLPDAIAQPLKPPGVVDFEDFQKRVHDEVMQLTIGGGKQSEGDPSRSIFQSLLNSPELPQSEKSPHRLEDEGTLLVLAGTDSPAKTLAITHYHILANPSILAKLLAELSTIPGKATWSQLEQLPYLSAVIEEGNRLSWGVTARTARIAPHESITYTPSSYTAGSDKSYTIPPATPISTTTLCVHTDPTIFPDPYAFNPDRFLGEEGQARRRFNMAFNKGSRKCVGIELAHAEIYLALAAVLRRFKMSLWETDERDVTFVHDYQVAFAEFGRGKIKVMVQGEKKKEKVGSE